MRALRSARLRLFLIIWIVYAAHFSTNIVREHYPAFSLVEDKSFRVDAYAGFHADIFEHTDGHYYVCNNVLPSVFAALPLFALDPLLDRLEAASRAKLAAGGPPDTSLASPFPNSQLLYRMAAERGLELRFGASAAITSVFLMAPLGALVALGVRGVLRRRGVSAGRADLLTLLFAFATPLFYRSAHLSHNVMLMAAVFAAFLCLWRQPGWPGVRARPNVLLAGCLAGIALALDYAGVLPALLLFGFALDEARRAAPAPVRSRALFATARDFALGALPAVAFLLASQWAQFGHPLRPAQFYMPAVNYTDAGLRGMSWPALETFVKNLVSPSYGLLPFAPLLALAFWPLGRELRARPQALVLPLRERRWTWAFALVFLLFCASNQYALMQFNTGFRYLMPLVPFLFLAACDRLARWRTRTLLWVGVPCAVHVWILTMARALSDTEQDLRNLAIARGVSQLDLPGYWTALFTQTALPLSYRRILSEGPELPWLRVLAGSGFGRSSWLAHPLAAWVVLALVGGVCLAIGRAGRSGSGARRDDRPGGLAEREAGGFAQ